MSRRTRADDQDRKVTCLRPVQFREKHALPASKLQTAVGDVETDGRGQQQRLTMRVPVDAFSRDYVDGSKPDVIVPVRSSWRRGPVEHLGKVGQQMCRGFVDHK